MIDDNIVVVKRKSIIIDLLIARSCTTSAPTSTLEAVNFGLPVGTLL
jgi:hypothetical protein